jgi:hypothetical protein
MPTRFYKEVEGKLAGMSAPRGLLFIKKIEPKKEEVAKGIEGLASALKNDPRSAELAEGLRHKNPAMREMFYNLLSKTELHHEAAPALLGVLRDSKDFTTRKNVLRLIKTKLVNDKAIEASLIKHGDPKIKALAARVYGQKLARSEGGRHILMKAFPFLLKARALEKEDMVRNAVDKVLRIHSRQPTKIDHLVLNSVLKHPESVGVESRKEAVALLGRVKTPFAENLLQEFLQNDASLEVKLAAIDLLSEMKSSEAFPLILDMALVHPRIASDVEKERLLEKLNLPTRLSEKTFEKINEAARNAIAYYARDPKSFKEYAINYFKSMGAGKFTALSAVRSFLIHKKAEGLDEILPSETEI